MHQVVSLHEVESPVLLEGVSLSVGPKDYRSVKKRIENAALVTRPEGSSLRPRRDLRNVEVSKAQRGRPSADRSHRFKPSHERSEPCGPLHHTHWIGSHRKAVLYSATCPTDGNGK